MAGWIHIRDFNVECSFTPFADQEEIVAHECAAHYREQNIILAAAACQYPCTASDRKLSLVWRVGGLPQPHVTDSTCDSERSLPQNFTSINWSVLRRLCAGSDRNFEQCWKNCSTMPSRGSISDSWYLYVMMEGAIEGSFELIDPLGPPLDVRCLARVEWVL